MTAILVIAAGAVLAFVAIAAWNKLRAEFEESFNGFSAYLAVALERTA